MTRRRRSRKKHPFLAEVGAVMVIIAIIVMLFAPTALRFYAAMNPIPPECFGLS